MSINTKDFPLLFETLRVISNLINIDTLPHISSLLSESLSCNTALARAEITTNLVDLLIKYLFISLKKYLKIA